MLGVRDCWTARSFDNAVMSFGIWVENRLNERDDDHMPKYTLDVLLGIEDDPAVVLHNNTVNGQMLAIMLGGQ